jgi:hypothetical protein
VVDHVVTSRYFRVIKGFRIGAKDPSSGTRVVEVKEDGTCVRHTIGDGTRVSHWTLKEMLTRVRLGQWEEVLISRLDVPTQDLPSNIQDAW